MSEPVITVENLSKRYLVGHQSAQRERYNVARCDRPRGAQLRPQGCRHGPRPPDCSGRRDRGVLGAQEREFRGQARRSLGIIGRNGAGKSTLAEDTQPHHGADRRTWILRGRVASLLEVGTGFHPELTGRENIYLNGAILGMTRAEIRKKFDEIVAFAEVENFSTRR